MNKKTVILLSDSCCEWDKSIMCIRNVWLFVCVFICLFVCIFGDAVCCVIQNIFVCDSFLLSVLPTESTFTFYLLFSVCLIHFFNFHLCMIVDCSLKKISRLSVIIYSKCFRFFSNEILKLLFLQYLFLIKNNNWFSGIMNNMIWSLIMVGKLFDQWKIDKQKFVVLPSQKIFSLK